MKYVKNLFITTLLLASCGDGPASGKEDNGGGTGDKIDFAEQNMLRAMEIADSTMAYHLVGSKMSITEFYNPFLNVRSSNIGGVWMYTSVIEGINAILNGLQAHREHGNAELYNKHYARYLQLLRKLYDNLDYYKGKYTVTSFTQTKTWDVYAVHRGNSKGTANTTGNVYDDQQWLIIELLKSYKITEDDAYLAEAEYLTGYVLDGWDCTLDNSGNEYGGISWGPGYVTKHACSNGPVVSPLVWLYELYKDTETQITYRHIDADKRTRKTATMKKSEYYLMFAEKVYNWQKRTLLRSDGVYDDMQGGCDAYKCEIQYEHVGGVKYRANAPLGGTAGPAITYNSGTMLSGAADLYRVTGNKTYLSDAKKLADASFTYFATPASNKPGCYTYELTGYRNWFNGVLMRGYVDIYPYYNGVDRYIDSFQKNLDFGYKNYLYKGFLPHDLLSGWKSNPEENRNAAMFSFAFAAEYANLARYELEE